MKNQSEAERFGRTVREGTNFHWVIGAVFTVLSALSILLGIKIVAGLPSPTGVMAEPLWFIALLPWLLPVALFVVTVVAGWLTFRAYIKQNQPYR